MARRLALVVVVVGTAALFAWLLGFFGGGLPRWYGRPAAQPPPAAAAGNAPRAPERKIKARLFYVAEDGTRLNPIERDVTYAEDTTSQAKEIISAQIAPVEDPLVSAIPAGTMLRAMFVTAQGQAFVDFSSEIAAAHPGGSLNELLTVYTIVDALTFNLPAVSSVQLLVDGKEVTTLAGHVDLRRPLAKNAAVIEEPPSTTEDPTRAADTDTRKPDAIR